MVPPHQAIGEPVPTWKYFPPAKVVGDVFGPTFRPKKSTGMAKPPFREAIAIALTKQVTRGVPSTIVVLGVCGEFRWVRLLVVCFIYKTNPNPRKSIRCGKKVAQMPLLT